MKAIVKTSKECVEVKSLFDYNGIWTGTYVEYSDCGDSREWSKFELDFDVDKYTDVLGFDIILHAHEEADRRFPTTSSDESYKDQEYDGYDDGYNNAGNPSFREGIIYGYNLCIKNLRI